MNPQPAVTAAIRFGLGPRPGEVASIGSDPTGWLKSQLTPSAALPPELAGLPTTMDRVRIATLLEKIFIGVVVEPGVLAQEDELDGTGRSTALLRDDHFRQPFIWTIRVVILISIDEHDDVRVLLDRP